MHYYKYAEAKNARAKKIAEKILSLGGVQQVCVEENEHNEYIIEKEETQNSGANSETNYYEIFKNVAELNKCKGIRHVGVVVNDIKNDTILLEWSKKKSELNGGPYYYYLSGYRADKQLIDMFVNSAPISCWAQILVNYKSIISKNFKKDNIIPTYFYEDFELYIFDNGVLLDDVPGYNPWIHS